MAYLASTSGSDPSSSVGKPNTIVMDRLDIRRRPVRNTQIAQRMDRAIGTSAQFREHPVRIIHDGVQVTDGHSCLRPNGSVGRSNVHDRKKGEVEPMYQEGSPGLQRTIVVLTINPGQNCLDPPAFRTEEGPGMLLGQRLLDASRIARLIARLLRSHIVGAQPHDRPIQTLDLAPVNYASRHRPQRQAVPGNLDGKTVPASDATLPTTDRVSLVGVLDAASDADAGADSLGGRAWFLGDRVLVSRHCVIMLLAASLSRAHDVAIMLSAAIIAPISARFKVAGPAAAGRRIRI